MDLGELADVVRKFRDGRGWKKKHKPKDLAISLSLEAAEFLEHFKWKTDSEVKKYLLTKNREDVEDELADVLHNVILIADELKIDLERTFMRKMKKNEKKYPAKYKV